jgi:hypothetical protein
MQEAAMKIGAHFALGAFVLLAAAAAGFADDGKPKAASQPTASASASTSKDSSTAAPSSAAASSSPAPAAPSASAPQSEPNEGTEETPSPKWEPMPASSGNPGLLTLETGETLSKGSFAMVAGVDKISRMPASVTVLQAAPALAIGVTDWLSVSFELQAWDYVHVGVPSELSLSPVNINNPQFRNTIYPSVLPVSGSVVNPAYVEDFPFAAGHHGDTGEVNVGAKIALLSEKKGKWMSLSLSNDFFIPTKTGYSSLVGNQVQNGGFSYQVGLEASKSLMHNSMVAVVNSSFQIFPSRSYTVTLPTFTNPSTLQQADQFLVGAGFLMFPGKRFQVISEYDGLIFVGSATPNTTFGARDPVDSITGIRVYIMKHLALNLGYRYNLNLTSDKDRNGFVANLSVVSWREKPAAAAMPADSVVTSCIVDKASLSAGSSDIVEATVNASDAAGHPLTYAWTASGGSISGSGPYARWSHEGLAAGSYTLSVRVDDGVGHSSSCSAAVTLTP